MTLADKARAAGLDERTIRIAYLPFETTGDANSRAKGAGAHADPATILEAHRRVCIWAACYDNPTGTHRFPQFGAGVVRA